MTKSNSILFLTAVFILLPSIACLTLIWINGFSSKIIESLLPTAGAVLALLASSYGLSKTIFEDTGSVYQKRINFAVFEYEPFKIVPITNILKVGFLNQSQYNGLKAFEDRWRKTFVNNARPQDEAAYQRNDPKFETFFQAQFLFWLSDRFRLGWEENSENSYQTLFSVGGTRNFGPGTECTKHIFLRDILGTQQNEYIDRLPQEEKLDLRVPKDSNVFVKNGGIEITSPYGSIEIGFFKNGDPMNAFQQETFSAPSVQKIHNTLSGLYPGKKIGDLLVRNFEIGVTCKRKSWRRFAPESEHLWSMCHNIAEAAASEFATINALAKIGAL